MPVQNPEDVEDESYPMETDEEGQEAAAAAAPSDQGSEVGIEAGADQAEADEGHAEVGEYHGEDGEHHTETGVKAAEDQAEATKPSDTRSSVNHETDDATDEPMDTGAEGEEIPASDSSDPVAIHTEEGPIKQMAEDNTASTTEKEVCSNSDSDLHCFLYTIKNLNL